MIGTLLANRYEVIREVGRGGMGIVYLARDTVLERDVAVKLLPPAMLSPEAEERFRREARVVGRMDHPAIVPLHDFAKHGDSVFLVMPFVQGSSLRKLLLERSVSVIDTIEIGIRVSEALEHSHGLGVIHRDIKPENVMVDREEDGTLRVRVADFGVAAAEFEERVTKSGVIVGTGSYLSPEQVSESAVDARSDLFALGVLLYEALAGGLPFTGSGAALYYKIAFSNPKSLRTINADVPPELDSLILKCLEKSPDRRPESARQLATALRALQPGAADGLRTPAPSAQPTVSFVGSAPGRTVLVNRENEFAALVDRLAKTNAGEAQLVLVRGAAGIGKTRLLDELDAAAHGKGIRVLHGRFFDRDQSFPFQGFCDAIQEYFVSEALTAAGAPTDLADLLPELTNLFPALGELASAKTTTSGVSDPSASHPSGTRAFVERSEIYELLARTIARIGGGRTLVLLLEDLHASDTSVEALQYVFRRCSATPTLFVATYRSEDVGAGHSLTILLESLRGDRRFELVHVGPLDSDAHRQLVASLIGSDDVVESLYDRLFEVTEGNPFFTSELVRSLLEAGDVAESVDTGWHVTNSAGITPESLPATIQQAVEQRIRRLTDVQREVLSTAAVLGRTFAFRDLELLAEEISELEQTIDWLVEAGFLVEDRESRGDRLTFASGIVRDALYASLARRRKRSLHRTYGQRLERRNAAQIERVLPELVHHFTQGDVPEKVVAYGTSLARRSLGAYSPTEARRAAETVLDVLATSAPESPAIEAEARDLLARALWMDGVRQPALDEFHRAIAGFRLAGDASRELATLATAAEVAWASRFADTAAELVERGLELGREVLSEPTSAASTSDADRACFARLLKLGATVASLRGDFDVASQWIEERDRLVAATAGSRIDIDRGATLRMAVPPTIRARHPVNCRTRGDVETLAATFETLLRTDANGVLGPNLVEKWVGVDGGRVFRLALRDDVRTHDGRPVTAEVARQSFELAIRACERDLPLAFAHLAGVEDYRCEQDERLRALSADGLELTCRFEQPLPIFPALLSDVRTALAIPAENAGGELVGTGPFSIRSFGQDRVTLARNPQPWRGAPANVAAIEVVGNLTGSELAGRAASGESDIVRGVPAIELEELLHDRRRRYRLVEAPGSNVWFLLFNRNRSGAASPQLRAAMRGILAVHTVVRTSIGRFAIPAEGLIPPGTLGHDPNRRRPAVSHEQVESWLSTCGPKRELKALVSFGFRHRHQKLVDTIVGLWSDYGINVTLRDSDSRVDDAETVDDDVDVYFGGWSGDYADPDAFTHALFHTSSGRLRRYLDSDSLDGLLESARLEQQSDLREMLYRQIEDRLQEDCTVIPLFYETEHRLASHRVRRLVLQSDPPYMNFDSVGKTPAPAAADKRGRRGGRISVPVPIGCDLRSLDPSIIRMDVESEVLGTIFEPLLRNPDGARVIPWLARSFDVEDGGRLLRFTLRDDVTFHNGRSLTSRDVRYSIERLLRNPESVFRWHLSPIRGAAAVLNGSTSELAGFRILSRLEFTIELEDPVAFFPSVLTDPQVSIVPEGSTPESGVWREAAVGTGPFHVVQFEPGVRLELDANLTYWREGLPRADGLVFTFGYTPQATADAFRSGRASIAWNLLPEDEASIRTDPAVAASYSEAPGLQTVILAFNVHRGPLADEAIRHHIVGSLDIEAVVRRASGPYATVANSIVPPGLIGHSGNLRTTGSGIRPAPLARDIELSCLMRPLYSEGSEAALRRELFEALEAIGIRARIHSPPREEWEAARAAAVDDMFLFGWIADYPDADSFIHGLLRSERGWIGRFCGTPDVDRLIDRSRTAVDPELRHDLYREIEAIVSRRALLLPLVHSRSYRYVRPEVRGLEVTLSLPYVAYEKLWIDSTR